MRQSVPIFFCATLTVFSCANNAFAETKKENMKYDFRPSLMSKTRGPQISGCGWSLDQKVLSQREICEGIKNKIAAAWLIDSNKIVRESLSDKQFSCRISLNGAGGIIETQIRESSGSEMLDGRILKLIRECGYFKINRTLNLEDHFYVVDLPSLEVKISLN
jgi:hypothetical protein